MTRVIYTIIFIATLSLTATAQTRVLNSEMMTKRCPENKNMLSSIILQTSGDVSVTPCPNKSNIFNNSLMLRKNSSDYYPYAHSFDSINEFSTDESFARNLSASLNINSTPFSSSSSYTNAGFYTTYLSPNRAGAVLGLFSNATLFSDAPVHDIQGIHGEALAVRGSAASGLYGGVFNVGLFGGVNHGNIADLTVGASTVRDTDVRNYYRFWIKRPTIANATIREGKNYSIYQEGPFGSEFQGYLFLNNANQYSSGADVSPLQIKTAGNQTAEALTVRDSVDAPLFSVNAGGQIRIANPKTPSSASEPCAVGTMAWDANNIYVCVAENTWRKSQLSSF